MLEARKLFSLRLGSFSLTRELIGKVNYLLSSKRFRALLLVFAKRLLGWERKQILIRDSWQLSGVRGRPWS